MRQLQIIHFVLIGLASIAIAMPQAAKLDSYNNLSNAAQPNASAECSQNKTMAQMQQQLSIEIASTTTSQAKVNDLASEKPEILQGFNYALLGQDPKDQHWYRVSLTPKDGSNNTAGFRAQIATRKQPPFVEKQAHKHEKALSELLHWLQTAEEQTLTGVYKELLNSELDNEPAESRKAIEQELIDSHEQDLYVLEQEQCSHEQKPQVLPLAEQQRVITDSKEMNNIVHFLNDLH